MEYHLYLCFQVHKNLITCFIKLISFFLCVVEAHPSGGQWGINLILQKKWWRELKLEIQICSSVCMKEKNIVAKQNTSDDNYLSVSDMTIIF